MRSKVKNISSNPMGMQTRLKDHRNQPNHKNLTTSRKTSFNTIAKTS
jgi:hypothetical protein